MAIAELREPTIGESLIWLNYTFSRTDKVAAALPDNLLNWRPVDPSGEFHFSLAEIVMHIADARRKFAAELSGADESANYWSPGYWSLALVPDEEAYRFKPYGGKQVLLDSLRQGRELYAPCLALPLSSITAVTEGIRRSHERLVAELKAAGEETDILEQRGPGTLIEVLLAVVAHESGHRGSLQTLLRLKGVNVAD